MIHCSHETVQLFPIYWEHQELYHCSANGLPLPPLPRWIMHFRGVLGFAYGYHAVLIIPPFVEILN